MATIRRRTDKNNNVSFHVQIRLKGYPTETGSFIRLTDARKWAAATESAIREGRYFKTREAKKHTFSDMVERYIKTTLPTKPKQQAKQTQQLNWWNERLGYHLLSDVTPALIVEYRDELSQSINRRGTKTSAATVVRYMAALSHCFTVCVNEWGWVDDSPLRKVKKPKESRGRVRYLDDNECTRLLNACKQSPNKQLYINVVLALSTGMRKSEQAWLTYKDVNLKEGYAILNDTKNGEVRRVALTGLALELLKEHSKIRRIDTPLLFPSDRTPTKPIDLKKAFDNALKVAEIDNFRWHDLRHTFASNLAMNGASLAEIAECMGHKTLSMVKRYAHLSESHVSGVVESMNSKIFGGV